MAADILDIIKNIDTIYSTNSSLNTLKDFERVLDELQMYVYKNWIDGELVSGPDVERHWVTASFMWPRNKMPDPVAAKRLVDYGGKVTYEKTYLLEPRSIKTPDDIRPGTKKGRLDHTLVWVVKITLPKKLVQDIYQGYMHHMKTEMGIGGSESINNAPPQASEVAAAEGMAAPVGGAAPAPVAGGSTNAAV